MKNIRKLDEGYSLQGNPVVIQGIITTLGRDRAKTSSVPETQNEKPRDAARIYKSRVGKVMYMSHHRPDIPHSVHTLSRSTRNPTTIAVRKLTKLTRYVLGTGEVYQEFYPDPHAEALKVPLDGDWADHEDTRQSCSGRTVLFRGCAVLTWVSTQKTRVVSRAEAELNGIGSGATEGLGAAQFLQEWQYKVVPLPRVDSQRAPVACQ